MPTGLHGLHVWLQPARARFTCRCGYVLEEGRSADAVRVFVEEIGPAHRGVCRVAGKGD